VPGQTFAPRTSARKTIEFFTGIALFVLRVKEPKAPRRFRVPGFPVELRSSPSF